MSAQYVIEKCWRWSFGDTLQSVRHDQDYSTMVSYLFSLSLLSYPPSFSSLPHPLPPKTLSYPLFLFLPPSLPPSVPLLSSPPSPTPPSSQRMSCWSVLENALFVWMTCLLVGITHTHTHSHTYIHTYIHTYMYMCMYMYLISGSKEVVALYFGCTVTSPQPPILTSHSCHL